MALHFFHLEPSALRRHDFFRFLHCHCDHCHSYRLSFSPVHDSQSLNPRKMPRIGGNKRAIVDHCNRGNINVIIFNLPPLVKFRVNISSFLDGLQIHPVQKKMGCHFVQNIKFPQPMKSPGCLEPTLQFVIHNRRNKNTAGILQRCFKLFQYINPSPQNITHRIGIQAITDSHVIHHTKLPSALPQRP